MKDGQKKFVKALIETAFKDDLPFQDYLIIVSGIIKAYPKLGRRMIYPVVCGEVIEISLSAVLLLDHDLIDEESKKNIISVTKKSLANYVKTF